MKAGNTVLIVDDNDAVLVALRLLLELHDFEVETVRTPEDAVARVGAGGVAAVIQDMNYGRETTTGGEGIALFHALRAIDGSLPVVLMTAWSSVETAVELVKEGAADYVPKPWNDASLVLRVQEIVGRRRTLQAARAPRLAGLVCASPAMRGVVDLALRVADSRAPVLITGPNGSGKEKIAAILQQNGARRDRPYVTVNAGALPSTLIEAELFGVEPGAFTGATRPRAGLFEAADGGTLFLDEIGNLSAGPQAALLRVLSTGEVTRLGSNRPRSVDVRVISATNGDLDTAMSRGEFRTDLYYRLAVVHLRVPPLGERPEDVLLLADHFLDMYRGERALRLGPRAEAALLAHAWPGNVRELENRVHRAVLIARDDVIVPGDLDLGGDAPSSRPPPSPRSLMPLDLGQRMLVEKALRESGGSITRAAEQLGISRQALYRRMRRVGLVLERRPRASE